MHYQKKLLQIYLPFLAAFVIGLSAYTFFHWLIIYRLHILPLSNLFTDVILPVVISTALLFLYHLGVMKKMDLKAHKKYVGKSESWSFLYGYVLWVVLTVPSVTAQFYLKSVAGEWRTLNHISEMVQHRPAPFYFVKNPNRLHFVKEHASSDYGSYVSGRYRATRNLSINIVVPIFDRPGDAIQDGPVPAWLGLSYKRTLSNFKSKQEKQQASRNMSDKVWKDFADQDLSAFVFLERVSNKYFLALNNYVKALNNNPWYKVDNRNILLPVNETMDTYRYGYLKTFLITLVSGCLLWLGMVLLRPLKKEEDVVKLVPDDGL